MFSFWYENIVIVCRKYEEIFDYKVKPQHIEKAKSDLDKYINYLNTNTDIKMRDFTRKFNIKKAEALIVLNAVKESKIIKNHILFKEIKRIKPPSPGRPAPSKIIKPYKGFFYFSQRFHKKIVVILHTAIDIIFKYIN